VPLVSRFIFVVLIGIGRRTPETWVQLFIDLKGDLSLQHLELTGLCCDDKKYLQTGLQAVMNSIMHALQS